MEILSSGSGILLAVLGLGFVIFIHELGHFLVAKWAGMRVDTFSIGFGPIVWSKTIGETEYAVSLLPVGGYVAPRVKADGSGRTLEEASAGWRALFFLAGVVFNAVSSFLILLCLAWYGMPMHPPVVGAVAGEMVERGTDELVPSPASRLGLRVGDRIISYNGQEPRSLYDVIAIAMDQATEPVQLEIERDGAVLDLPAPGAEPVHLVSSRDLGRASLGIAGPSSRRIEAASGAGAAELALAGWYVEAVNGEDVDELIGQELTQHLAVEVGREVELVLRRDDETRSLVLTYAGDSPAAVGAAALGFPVVIEGLVAGLPAEAAGIETGDVLMAVDGEPVISSAHLIALVQRRADHPFTLSWLHREGADWVERSAELATVYQEDVGKRLIGIQMDNRRSGVLPYLPAIGEQANPLAAAGVEPGDAVVAVTPSEDPADTAIAVHYLRGGSEAQVLVSGEGSTALRRPYEPPLLMKFLGARPRASIVGRLLGTQVLEVGGPGASATLLRVDDPSLEAAKRYQVIDLAELPDGPRAELLAGLQSGDWIVDVMPADDGSGDLRFDLVRGVQPEGSLQATVQPAPIGVALTFGRPYTPPYQLSSWLEAFPLAGEQSLSMLTTTFKIIPKFFRDADEGGVDASKSLAGPIGIFSELKARAELGLASFLHLLALLGLNLVIVNLLPIPIADGGRLLMLLVEVVIRRPVPERVENAVNVAGFVFIVTLMLFVIGVDVLRTMGLH